MKNREGFMLSSIVTMLVVIIMFISWQLVRFEQEQNTFVNTEQLLQSLNKDNTTTNNN